MHVHTHIYIYIYICIYIYIGLTHTIITIGQDGLIRPLGLLGLELAGAHPPPLLSGGVCFSQTPAVQMCSSTLT